MRGFLCPHSLTARQDISPFNSVYLDDPKVLVFPDDTNFKLTLALLLKYQKHKHISLLPFYMLNGIALPIAMLYHPDCLTSISFLWINAR